MATDNDVKAALVAKFSAMTLDELIEARQARKAQIEPIEKELDIINEQTKLKMVEGSHFDGYRVGKWIVTLSRQVRTSIDKAKLLQLGILPSVIQRATVETPSVRLDVKEYKGDGA